MKESNFGRAYNRPYSNTPTHDLVFRLRADAQATYDDLRAIGAELRRRQAEQQREVQRGACAACAGSGREASR